MHLIDGQSMFNMPIQQYWRTVWWEVARRSGLHTPDPDRTSSENPSILHISHGRLVATCPNCQQAEYVWRKGPHVMVCANCGNADIKGRCRIVVMPKPGDLDKIEALLLERPNPANRNWYPEQSLADLVAENEEHL